jgi:hypothetical protein
MLQYKYIACLFKINIKEQDVVNKEGIDTRTYVQVLMTLVFTNNSTISVPLDPPHRSLFQVVVD